MRLTLLRTAEGANGTRCRFKLVCRGASRRGIPCYAGRTQLGSNFGRADAEILQKLSNHSGVVPNQLFQDLHIHRFLCNGYRGRSGELGGSGELDQLSSGRRGHPLLCYM